MKVLVAIDEPLFAETILAYLKVNNWPTDTQIRLVHVLDTAHLLLNWPNNILEKNAKSFVESVVENYRAAFPEIAIDGVIHKGVTTVEIEKELDEWGGDILVVGSHGRHGLGRALIGSVSSALSKTCSKPVIIVAPSVRSESDDLVEEEMQVVGYMSPLHKQYFEQHKLEHPFPLNGSDWCRLVQMRLNHADHEDKCDCVECENLLTRLHSLYSLFPHVRGAERFGVLHWFSKECQPQRAFGEEQNSGNHALKVLRDLGPPIDALRAAERDWCNTRTRVMQAPPSGEWLGEDHEQRELKPLQQEPVIAEEEAVSS